MKVIIAGGRDFNDTGLAAGYLLQLVEDKHIPDVVTIISGGARGADKVGEYLAELYELPLEIYPADWNKYGKSAGYKRNSLMAANANVLIAFWDGKSRGTKHMIETIQQQNKPVFICYYA